MTDVWNGIVRFVGRNYSLIVLLVLWDLISRSGLVSPRLVPNIWKILTELAALIGNGDLFYHGMFTLQRVFLGYGLAIIGGIALGTLIARSRLGRELIEPSLTFTYPIPRIALYPVCVVAFGFGDMSKIILIFIECLYPIALQTYHGMRQADRILVWAARGMGSNNSTLFWRVLVPSAAPSIFAGVRIALPVALILAIVTEIIGGSTGLGYLIAFTSASYEYGMAMAVLAVTGIIGFLCDRLLIALQHHVIYWQRTVPVVAGG